MRKLFTAAAILLLAIAVAPAQERATPFDAGAARRQLSAEVAVTPPRFITKGIGGDPVTERCYTKSAIVVTHASGAKEEHPYVAIPLLFQKNSDELLDRVSSENVGKVAQLLKDLDSAHASFAIEGHASAEGDPARNLELSKLRAAKIQSLLREQGVPAGELVRVEGFGAAHAQHAAAAPEPELQADRRVLVVKER